MIRYIYIKSTVQKKFPLIKKYIKSKNGCLQVVDVQFVLGVGSMCQHL